MTPRTVGRASALGAALIWGSSWVATRFALDDVSALGVAAWRGLGPAILLGAALAVTVRVRSPAAEVVAGTPPPPALGPRLIRLGVLGALGGLGFIVGMSVAVALTGATMAAFVAGLYPVAAAVGAPYVLGERSGRAPMIALLAAFVGVLLLGGFDPGGVPVAGLLVGVASAVAFGAYLLLARRWSTPYRLSPLVVTFANFALLAAVTVPLVLATDGALLPPSPSATGLIALAWLVVVAGVIANLLLVVSVRRLPAQESAAYLLVNPLTAAILAAILLGERLAPVQIAGAVLVLVSIGAAALLGARRPAVRQPADAPPRAVG